MSVEKNRAFIGQFYEDLHSDDFSAVIDTYLAEDFFSHYQSLDRNGYKEVTRALKAAYPDMRNIIEDIIAEHDKVVVRFRVISKKKSFSAISIHRIANGKIAEMWVHSDSFF